MNISCPWNLIVSCEDSAQKMVDAWLKNKSQSSNSITEMRWHSNQQFLVGKSSQLIGLREKYRKIPYFMKTSMVSCRFSLFFLSIEIEGPGTGIPSIIMKPLACFGRVSSPSMNQPANGISIAFNKNTYFSVIARG